MFYFGPLDQRGSKVVYENSGPKFKNNSGDAKMVWFIFTREMYRWSDLVPREMLGLIEKPREM